jgi:hypothetical protein
MGVKITMPLPGLSRLSLVLWLAGCPGVRGADHGYLPLAGPPPLRFALPPVATTDSPSQNSALPPLPILNPPSAAGAAETNQSPAAAAITNAPSPALQTTAGSDTNSPPSPLANNPADVSATAGFLLPVLLAPLAPDPNAPGGYGLGPAGGPLTPQTFLRYFTPAGTNLANGASVIVPVSFVPPEPVQPPSSSATFETTPPGKP